MSGRGDGGILEWTREIGSETVVVSLDVGDCRPFGEGADEDPFVSDSEDEAGAGGGASASDNGNASDVNSDDEDENVEVAYRFSVELRKDGHPRSLVFRCETDGEDLEVQAVQVHDGEMASAVSSAAGSGASSDFVEDDGPIPYEGPSFDALDGDLQGHLYSLLWARGVDRDLVRWIHAAAEDKEQAEYVKWLDEMDAWLSHAGVGRAVGEK